MYGDLVEWLEKEIETCEYVKEIAPAATMHMNPEIAVYKKVLNWIEGRRSKSYAHKCQVQMEEAAKSELVDEMKKVEDYFKDKTEEEIMEIVRRNGGKVE